MKKKYSFRAATTTAFIISTALLLSWFASMFGITLSVADNYVDYFNDLGENLSWATALCSRQTEESSDTWDDGLTRYWIWEALSFANNNVVKARSNSDGGMYYAHVTDVDFKSAVSFYDGNGNILDYSGDFFYFAYDTEEAWDASGADAPNNICGFAKVAINISAIDEQNHNLLDENFSSWRDFIGVNIEAMRFTGVLDGTTLVVSKIEYVLHDDFHGALTSREPDAHYIDGEGNEVTEYSYSVSEVIRTENVPWRTLFEYGPGGDDGEVTLYTTMPELSDYSSRDSYLLPLLLASGTRNEVYPNSSGGIRELTVLSKSHVYDYDELIPDSEGSEVPVTKYIVTAAMRFFPLRSAMKVLIRLYIVTGIIALALSLYAYLKIRRKLIIPIQEINTAVSNDYTRITDNLSDWREVKELHGYYGSTLDKLNAYRSEITRLETALNYAKSAEEHRRQMTSNIAHELKTPLAIIQSYAEGLNEHIAEDKKEQYYSVIQSETGRMNDMIMEMLDLSRLEAGRVKLSREDFSLPEIVAPVFERLERAIEAKELVLTMELDKNCIINADMTRIEQVITNFAVNAVKYTPSGGNILVRTIKSRGAVMFSVENDSPPLSSEALSKVWETFYSADESRTASGTGLGLAIAKSIIDLHGGKCSARNTKTGVEFSFTIE